MKPDLLVVQLGAATLLSFALRQLSAVRVAGRDDASSFFTTVRDAAPSRRRCLIVDDDPLVRETVRDMLKSRGYETVMAGDGVEGLEKFKEEPFDLVLTDLRMPKLDGLQFARAGKGLRQSVPFLLLTGFSATVTDEELSKAAVDRVLSKPIRLTDLITAIAEVHGPQP